MNSQTYISDPKLWEVFYKNMADKSFNPYKYAPKQIGRDVKSHKSYVIPVTPNAHREPPPTIQQVIPMAAIEERAKAEHKNDLKEGVAHVKVSKTIKRKRNQTADITLRRTKAFTSQKKRAKGRKNKETTKKKTIINTRQKPRNKKTLPKKEFLIDTYKTVFNK